MNDLMIKMYLTLKSLMAREEGQDLVEYALVVALIAFGAITGMKLLATGLNNAFDNITNALTQQHHIVPTRLCRKLKQLQPGQ